MRILEQRQEELRQALRAAVAAAVTAGELKGPEPAGVHLEAPRSREHGDFATNLALTMAKAEGQPPRVVAEALVRHLDRTAAGIAAVAVAGPGFLNFHMRSGWLHAALAAAQDEDDRFGASDYGGGRRILLEYVSANPTGPMVLVQARAGAVGSTLGRLLNRAGFDCQTEFYVNDAGNQIRLLALSVDIRARQLRGEVVELAEGCYPGEYVRDAARQLLDEQPDFPQRPVAERLEFLEVWATRYFRDGQEAALRRYGVVFDRWYSERSLRAAGKPQVLVRELLQRGEAYETDGAVWMRTTAYGDDKDRVLVKSDGEPTYFCVDACYHQEKYQRGYAVLINILGQDHHGYEGRMQAMVQCLGQERESLELLFTQIVHLVRGGEVVRMSKRRGEFITLEDLLDEVSVDAARFFFLTRSLDAQMEFNLDLANLQTSENPVYYVQYAHARIASLIRQAAEAGVAVPRAAAVPLDLLTAAAEVDLVRKIAELPEEIIAAAVAREPHRLSRYAAELATVFHTFYTRHRVLGAESPDHTRSRLVLADAARIALRNTLDLMGVSAPERM